MKTALLEKRKRINFMIDAKLLQEMERVVPSGERSDFVNVALEEKLKEWSRKKATELIHEFKLKNPMKMKSSEILKIIKNDRRT